jgi:RHS repeat-associated protein
VFASNAKSLNYAYDPATGFHTRTYTANSDITYAPDQLQRLKTVTVTKQNGVTLGTPLVTTYFYTPVGTIDHITYPNTTETDYGYDTLNRLTSVTNKRGTTLLSSYVYTLEADGLRIGVTEQQLESDTTTSTVTKIWTYDALQRLTQEQVTSSISANSYTDTYTMDLVGNRLTKTHTQEGQTLTSNYTYNSNDQLTTETGSGSSTYSTTYAYDTNGSLTSVTRTGASAETDTYGYDLQNRMNSANISRTENGQAVTIAASYTYNDDGIRGASSVTTTIGNGSPNTTATQYLVDWLNYTGYAQVLEEHINNNVLPSMSYLLGLSVFGQTNASGATSILLPDGQGSTRLVTDTIGTILAREAYDAYGSLLGAAVGILNVPATSRLYTNQEFDINLLQYNLRARIYNPATGRFGAMDAFQGWIREPRSFHKYAYTPSNPINYDDPTGHEWGLAGFMLAGSIFGGLAGLSFGTYLGVRQTGTFFSWTTVKYALIGLVGGALAGALLGGIAFFGPATLRVLRAGFTDLWTKVNGPHWKTASMLVDGFFTGLVCGFIDPDWPVGLGSAIAIGTLILSNDALIRGAMSLRVSFLSAGTMIGATKSARLFMIKYAQGGTFMTLGFAAGFVIGYTLGAEIQLSLRVKRV